MKTFLRILCSILFCFSLAESNAQTCPAGYTTTAINWDALAFLVQDASNVTATIAQNQKFAFGRSQMNIAHNFTNANTLGDNTTNTASAGSNGDGADVQFTGNGRITVSFQTAVQNVRFSVYDIDLNQRIAISAFNGLAAQPITSLTRLSGSVLTVAGSGTNSASATAGNISVANNNTDGTINVNIAGPVTSFIIDVTATGIDCKNANNCNEDGSFWLSDIAACAVTDLFPTGYRSIAKPLTNQPGYILVARNNIVFMTDPATGRSVEVFRDPSLQNINSMGYDPYNRILYFTNSLTGTGGTANAANKTLKKYNFDTETLSVVTPDITTLLGIPTFGSGVESGGASFYDGALYLGIEGTGSTRSTIWRIDFDAALNPIAAKQAFGIPLTGHDWGDFVIANGILYDFDGAASGAENVFHIDLQTGAFAATYPAPFGIRQVGTDWTEQVFNIGGAPSSTGEVVPYNYNGTVDATQFKTITVGTTTPSGSWGDAAEAFKPKVDFGDAPATYDPDPLSPAFHELNPNLRFGNNLKTEWNKLSTSNTDDDDDGLNFVPILNQGGGVYQTYVNVFNNTGASAIVAGWMDFNGDGIFDVNEGVTTTVGSNASMQSVSLYWTGIAYNLPNNSNTYLRIRITSATNAMSKSTPTGYFADGEVEDWYVLVNTTTLAVQLKSFTTQKIGTKEVKLNWVVTNETGKTIYEVQKSKDGINWHAASAIKAFGKEPKVTYSFIDVGPYHSINYYRIKYNEPGVAEKYSAVQQVSFEKRSSMGMFPNPAQDQVTLNVDATKEEAVQLNIVDLNGRITISKMLELKKGSNNFSLPVYHLTDGIYYVQVYLADRQHIQKLIVKKK